jgi:hypothetical protein
MPTTARDLAEAKHAHEWTMIEYANESRQTARGEQLGKPEPDAEPAQGPRANRDVWSSVVDDRFIEASSRYLVEGLGNSRARL